MTAVDEGEGQSHDYLGTPAFAHDRAQALDLLLANLRTATLAVGGSCLCGSA